jgi:RNA polymerase sigma factor (sigma-70 family)
MKKFGEKGFPGRLFSRELFLMPYRPKELTPQEMPMNEAAETILDQHEQSLLLYISGKLGAEGASLVPDIWQEVSLAVCQHCFETRPVEDPLNWLRRIASNKIADHWRSTLRGRKADTKWVEHQHGASLQGGLDWVLHQSCRDRVSGVLADLEAGDRRLLREKYLEGYTVAEMARRAGLGEKVIEHRLARARATFRERLSREP